MQNYSPAIQDWIDTLGQADTEKLIEAYHGYTLYVPYKPSRDIVDKLGQDLAQKLSDEYAGCTWRVPRGDCLLRQKRNASIFEARKEGKSLTDLARFYDLSYSTIRKILAESDFTVDLIPQG